MTTPEPTTREESLGSSSRPAATVRVCVLRGLQIALIGSISLAAIESAAVAAMLRKYIEEDFRPFGLLAASIGKNAVTYLLLLGPCMALAGVGYVMVRRRSASAACEPFLTGLFTLLAALIVLPADMQLTPLRSGWWMAAACVASVIGAALAYLICRFLWGRMARNRARMILLGATLVALALTAGTGLVFVCSPLFDPATYRLPSVEPIKLRMKQPHILWIDLDTVRADRMGFQGYGANTTPFLDAWADKSIVFDRAVADGIWTAPTHASMFTGMSVRQHGMDWNHLWLDENLSTVAEHLSKAGYESIIFSNNPLLLPRTNLVKGFGSVRDVYDLKRMSTFSLQFLAERWGITPLLPWFDRDMGAALTNRWVGDWLDDHVNGDKPLFLFVHYMEAHLPYRVPKSYRRMFMTDAQVDRSYDLRKRVYGDLNHALDLRYNTEGPGFLADSDRDILRLQYDATIRYLDDRIKELIGIFEQRELLDNTLVVITSDHGEYLGTHGMWEHRCQVYDDVAHVPLILREPGRKSGLRITTPVQQSDLYTTIIKAALGTPPAETGPFAADLFEIAAAGGRPRNAVILYGGPGDLVAEDFRASKNPEVLRRLLPQQAVVDGRFKYIVSGDGRRELYDLREDPQELRNLIEERPGPAKRLGAFLDAWLKRIPKHTPAGGDTPRDLDPDTIEALRGLGYIGNKD